MTEAATLGLLKGGDNGAMYPDSDLTWGQCLIMLGRAFYAPALSTHPVLETDHWAKGAYDAAMTLDVLEQADFLSVSPTNLDAPITRQDTVVLIDRALYRVAGLDPVTIDLSAGPTDFISLPEPYRAAVLQCTARGIVKGYEDGRFGGGDRLTRASGAAFLVRALALATEKPDDAGTTTPPPLTQPTDTPTGGPLIALGDNAEKRVRLYGVNTVSRFPSKEEAEAHITTVTVPVWKLETSGAKTPSTLSFRVHEAIAGDMAAIFTAIYNDPEQFPIKDIGGYAWRGDNAKGEHNCGTAVDINYMENYQIYPSGAIGAGSFWLPGENPYSIPEGGSVVRIFNAHGYSWGGNAWPSTSNKDYMHFSYLGL